MHRSICMLREARVVRYHADRRSAGVQFFQQIHYRFAIARIEISGRLIREQNRGSTGKRARDRDTLLLPTAELARQMFGPMAHPDAFERLCNCALAITRAHPALSQRQLHTFINGEIANQIETLENETDLAIANTGALRE